MKIKRTEYGIEMVPETAYDKECLSHLARQNSVKIYFEDQWDRTGNLIIEGQPHPWDAK